MTNQIPFSNSKLNKVMSTEQFEEIVEAILNGKYSWACLLILRFAGYNPLHYIPYRTYNRLMKENCQIGKSSPPKTDNIKTKNQFPQTLPKVAPTAGCLNQLKDLTYLEAMDKQETTVRGGLFSAWVGKNQELASPQNEILPVKNIELISSFWVEINQSQT